MNEVQSLDAKIRNSNNSTLIADARLANQIKATFGPPHVLEELLELPSDASAMIRRSPR